MNFIIIKAITRNEFVVIDKKRKKIISLESGQYIDKTSKCEQLFRKEKNKNNPTQGYNYYDMLVNNSSKNWLDIILNTDNQLEFDKKVMDIIKNQILIQLKIIDCNINKLEKNVQYYTYELNNM